MPVPASPPRQNDLARKNSTLTFRRDPNSGDIAKQSSAARAGPFSIAVWVLSSNVDRGLRVTATGKPPGRGKTFNLKGGLADDAAQGIAQAA